MLGPEDPKYLIGKRLTNLIYAGKVQEDFGEITEACYNPLCLRARYKLFTGVSP